MAVGSSNNNLDDNTVIYGSHKVWPRGKTLFGWPRKIEVFILKPILTQFLCVFVPLTAAQRGILRRLVFALRRRRASRSARCRCRPAKHKMVRKYIIIFVCKQ